MEGPVWAGMFCPPKLRDFRGQHVYALSDVSSKHVVHAMESGLPLRRWWQSLGSVFGERNWLAGQYILHRNTVPVDKTIRKDTDSV